MADKKKPTIGEGLKEGAQIAGDFVLSVGDALVALASEKQAEVAYYYDDTKNPTGASFPGVPLCDIHTDQLKTYPKWIQKSIKGSEMYVAANASDEAEGDKE